MAILTCGPLEVDLGAVDVDVDVAPEAAVYLHFGSCWKHHLQ